MLRATGTARAHGQVVPGASWWPLKFRGFCASGFGLLFALPRSMTSLSRVLGWFLIVTATAGCSGKANTDSDAGAAGSRASSGGSSIGGSSSSGPYVGGATGVSGTTLQSGGVGGQASAECRQLDDQASWAVPVRIINQTSKTIYFGDEVMDCSFNTDLPFQVADQAGSVLAQASPCRTSCAALRNGDVGGCPDSCSPSLVIALKPGEEVATTWSGLFAEQATMPSECVPEGSDLECTRARHVQPGAFTFSAQAGLAMDCSQTAGEACGTCTAEIAGGCWMFNAVISGERITATTEVTLDAGYGVWADSSAASSAEANIAVPQAVQLVFAD